MAGGADSDPPHLQHAAVLYGSAGELHATVVPFLRAGFARSERVVVEAPEELCATLAQIELGGHVEWRPLGAGAGRPSRAIASWERMIRQSADRGVCALFQPPLGHDTPLGLEWARADAVLNRLLARARAQLLCAYDVHALPPVLVHHVARTHPLVATSRGLVPSPAYVEPEDFLRRTEHDDADLLETTEPTLVVRDLRDLAGLRWDLATATLRTDLAPVDVAGFVGAVHEVAANALHHGIGPVEVRLWSMPDRLMCTVADHGTGFDDPLAGYRPPDLDDTARPSGLWVARQLCERVQVHTTPLGCTARVEAWSPGGAPPTG